MRVLHLPTLVGGNAWGLAQGERALGLDSSVMVAVDSWLHYPADIHLHLERIPSPLGQIARLALTFLRVRGHYQVFHFNFGSSLLSIPYRLKGRLLLLFKYIDHLDLSFYPRRARLFVTYAGCDARQKYPTMGRRDVAACHHPQCYGGQCNSGRLDAFRQHGIARMSRYVRHMWALNPDLLHFLPAGQSSFLPYTVSHWDEISPSPPRLEKRRLRIVHAPTDREAKGSEHILQALERIERTHPGWIEIQLIERLPHEQALKIYRGADLIIDQILIGWYGAVAVEAMKMGKPVIARIAEEDLHGIPPQMAQEVRETIIQADPNTLDETLLKCLEDRHFLKQRAEASLAYVHRWHDPRYVATLTKERYESD